MKRRGPVTRRRSFGSLAIGLVSALYLSMVTPALADYESAVQAFERGDYIDARSEFEKLRAAGDERAGPYLARINQILINQGQSSGSFLSRLEDSVSSLLSGNDKPGDAGSSRGSGSSESVAKPETLGRGVNTGPQATRDNSPLPSRSKRARPVRRTFWSALYFLPGDATLIVLQYGAQLFGADGLRRDLRILSHHSNKIVLGIMAAFWWAMILKWIFGLCKNINRLVTAAAMRQSKKRSP